MEISNDNFDLTPEQIEKLSVMDVESMPLDGQLFRGVVFNNAGQAIGRVEELSNLYKPKPILWQDLNKKQFPEQKWIIPNLIPQEGFVILASPSGEKKTWFALEVVRAIVSMDNFLGEIKFKTENKKVLYIDQEMSKGEFQRRGRLLGFGDSTEFWILSQDNLNLNDDESIEWLVDFIEKNEIGVVFIDTLRAVAGGMKEEKAEEARAFFNRFKPLKDKGVVVIFLDHCRKPQRFEGKIPKKEQLFASQDKVASVEVLLMLKSEAGSNEIAVYQNKNRLGKEIKAFKILMKEGKESEIKLRLIYGGEFEEQELKKDTSKDLILGAIYGGGKTTKELIEIGKLEGIAERTIRQATRELEDKGLISMPERKGRENYYILAKVHLDVNEDSDLSQQEVENLKESKLI